jgi:hypothetical protein
LALRDAPPPKGAAVPQTRPTREVAARENDIRRGRGGSHASGRSNGAPDLDLSNDPGAAASQVLRQASPEQHVATRWMPLAYLFVAYILCALVLWLLSWQ